MEKKLIIANEHGLHARPAALFVKSANDFQSKVEIESKERRINGKSIMSILSLNLDRGDEINLIVAGVDEDKAFMELEKIIHGK